MALLDIFRKPPAAQPPLPLPPPADAAGKDAPAAEPIPNRGVVGRGEAARALALLREYKAAKANLEARIIEDERWWKLRHWETLRQKKAEDASRARPEPASAWLFNTLTSKHADAMDNYPEPTVLPRERSDEQSARALSVVLPVVLEQNRFEDVYSDNWWYKLKHGTACYGVFWDKELENGLGDIAIRKIDLLNLFWEPGITDIQKSRNLFLVALCDTDLLEAEYPEHRGKLGGQAVDIKKYVCDDTVDTAKKSVVIDWYYKVRSPGGRTRLHYCKFCGDTVLFASENDPRFAETGWYGHGEYPVVFDTLFPEDGTPFGFGYIAVTKDPQMFIDKLGQAVMENALMAIRPRYFASGSTGINEQEFLDWQKPIIHVEGQIAEERLVPLEVRPLPGIYADLMQMKIEEMKETSSNRDFSQGGVGGGVTAAAAIAALQEAGNKTSRDMISASFRAYSRVMGLCVELIRQFYDETRSFRITGQSGGHRFADFSNTAIREQRLPPSAPGMEPMFRRPVFDIRIKAQKRSPYSRVAQNELAKELYGMGFFDPRRAEMALGALELMEFEGREKVMDRVQKGQTLLAAVRKMQADMQKMELVIGQLTGKNIGAQPGGEAGNSFGTGAAGAGRKPATPGGGQPAQRAAPPPESGGGAGVP